MNIFIDKSPFPASKPHKGQLSRGFAAPLAVAALATLTACQPAKVSRGTAVHCSMDANGSATLITWVAPGGAPASAAGANDAALSFSTTYAQPGTYTITASICLGAACSSRSAAVEVQ